jgi:hypothetical protein
MCRTSRDSERNSRQSEIRHVSYPYFVVDGKLIRSECVSKFELHKIYDTQLTPEQADELALAEAVVRAFVTWDISPESVDVAMQVREMLEKAELEVQEALEQGEDDSQGEGGEEGGDQMTQSVRVVMDDDDENEGEAEQISGGRSQVARINNESEEEDED